MISKAAKKFQNAFHRAIKTGLFTSPLPISVLLFATTVTVLILFYDELLFPSIFYGCFYLLALKSMEHDANGDTHFFCNTGLATFS